MVKENLLWRVSNIRIMTESEDTLTLGNMKVYTRKDLGKGAYGIVYAIQDR